MRTLKMIIALLCTPWIASSQNTTADAPVSFMRDLVSTDSLEFGSAFSPDGSAFYFSRSVNKKSMIFFCRKQGTGWTKPEPAPFSNGNYADADPAFSPEGELYFISTRPLTQSGIAKDYDIWKVIPQGNSWSEAVNVRELNSDKNEFYISFTKEGDAYFSSSRDGGYGEEDIYYSEHRNGSFSKPENAGDKINSIHSEYDPYITPNGSGLIFTSSGREDSFGRADLYWAVGNNGSWSGATHFDDKINTVTRDYCPYVSPDAKRFFYSSNGDVKFISTDYLPTELRKMLRN